MTTQTISPSLLATLNGTSTTGSGSSTSNVQQMNDQFLTLLTTQLKNQDPMNPMDNSQFTSQLAQMSTVEGVNNLNKTMGQLLSSYQSGQTLQATSLIGHEILTPGNVLTLSNGAAAGAADLAGAADGVTVSVLNSSGQVVDNLSLGARPAGQFGFSWDGKDAGGNALPDGQYSFSVNASAAGSSVTVTPLALAPVTSVSLTNGSVSLDVAGIGQVPLSQVNQVF